MPERDDDFCNLMRRLGEGSQEAAWELVDRYGEDIRRTVRRVLCIKLRPKFDSLDFVQLVWNSFFRARANFDRFHRPEELAAYLAAMAPKQGGHGGPPAADDRKVQRSPGAIPGRTAR